jgi:tetratricopeptide (TPR) repeat protein
MAAFKKPKKWRRLSERLKEFYRQRFLLATLLTLAGSALGLYLLVYLLRETVPVLEEVAEEEKAEVVLYDAAGRFDEAHSLIEKAQAHQYRGRKEEVMNDYLAALAVLDEIKEKSPAFRPVQVKRYISLCEERIRKAK